MENNKEPKFYPKITVTLFKDPIVDTIRNPDGTIKGNSPEFDFRVNQKENTLKYQLEEPIHQLQQEGISIWFEQFVINDDNNELYRVHVNTDSAATDINVTWLIKEFASNIAIESFKYLPH